MAAGDALGAPYEFHGPFPDHFVPAMTGGGGFGWEPGEWTFRPRKRAGTASGRAGTLAGVLHRDSGRRGVLESFTDLIYRRTTAPS